MNHFKFGVTCPRCKGPLEMVNTAAMDCGYRVTAIFACARRQCPEWQFVGELMTCGKPPSLASAGGDGWRQKKESA